MKGFLKRDFFLIESNLRFYAVFMVLFAGIAIFTDTKTTMFAFYVILFGMSSIMGLFNYDEFNHWMAYGAAVSGGRRTMVDARYLLTVLVGAGVVAVQMFIGLLAREEDVFLVAALYGGLFLLYSSLVLPLSYRFGGTKGRIVIVAVIAGATAIGGMGGAALSISGGGGFRLPTGVLLFPLVGLAGLALSRQISLNIMAKKEL